MNNLLFSPPAQIFFWGVIGIEELTSAEACTFLHCFMFIIGSSTCLNSYDGAESPVNVIKIKMLYQKIAILWVFSIYQPFYWYDLKHFNISLPSGTNGVIRSILPNPATVAL